MDIEKIYKEIIQSRSNYQIEKFVLGQHHSPEMQYHQLIMELRSLKQNQKIEKLKLEKTLIEANELLETGKKSDVVESEIKKEEAKEIELSLHISQKEIDYFERLLQKFPSFTRQEIENKQKDYWETKLTRVAQLQFLGSQTGVNWAQLDALQQANLIEQSIEEIPTLSKIKNNFLQLTINRKRGKNDWLPISITLLNTRC